MHGVGVTEDAAAERLERVATLAALRWRTEPVLVPSHSNDTWLIDEPSRGPAVLRVAWRGDPGRLVTEAKVGRALPPAVGYPEVLGFGWTRDEADLTWVLTRRLSGVTLAEAWDGLTSAQRGQACASVAARVQVLHRWRPSAAVSDRLLVHDPRPDRAAVIGATLNPLPLHRLRVLAEPAHLPTDRAELARRAYAWLVQHADLAPALDEPGLPVTHGDLHLANVWWDGSEVVALLDLEWVRRAPAWVELSRVLDQLDDPGRAEAHRQLLAALTPAVSSEVDRLDDRLRYHRIAHQVRQLHLEPPGSARPRDHPVVVLSRLLG